MAEGCCRASEALGSLAGLARASFGHQADHLGLARERPFERSLQDRHFVRATDELCEAT